MRPVRFRTDAVTSANMGVPAAFRLGETRKLPGKPKAVDRFVAKVMHVLFRTDEPLAFEGRTRETWFVNGTETRNAFSETLQCVHRLLVQMPKRYGCHLCENNRVG